MMYGVDEKGRYYVEHYPVKRAVGNVREESELFARKLFDENKNITLSLSSGLDSQLVLHSFLVQGLKINTAFMHLPGYNDNEYEQIKVLEKKYNISVDKIDLDPIALKDEVMEEWILTGQTPYHNLHKRFLARLDPETIFIQGLNGPDMYVDQTTNKSYFMQSYNSFETMRARAFDSLNRPGKVIEWFFESPIMLSILKESIIQTYSITYNYFINNDLVYKTTPTSTKEVPTIIDHWDLYLKPHIYANYWREELEFFPKFGGPEHIDYIMTGPKGDYKSRTVFIQLETIIDHLTNGTEKKRFYERKKND
jgi:hypothetical protein